MSWSEKNHVMPSLQIFLSLHKEVVPVMLRKSPQDMSEKTKVYQTRLVFPTALGNLLYKLLSDCFFFSLFSHFFYAFQHDNLT